MEVLKVQKGQIVAKKNDKVKEWYFIRGFCYPEVCIC